MATYSNPTTASGPRFLQASGLTRFPFNSVTILHDKRAVQLTGAATSRVLLASNVDYAYDAVEQEQQLQQFVATQAKIFTVKAKKT